VKRPEWLTDTALTWIRIGTKLTLLALTGLGVAAIYLIVFYSPGSDASYLEIAGTNYLQEQMKPSLSGFLKWEFVIGLFFVGGLAVTKWAEDHSLNQELFDGHPKFPVEIPIWFGVALPVLMIGFAIGLLITGISTLFLVVGTLFDANRDIASFLILGGILAVLDLLLYAHIVVAIWVRREIKMLKSAAHPILS
jgi:hypothetical protein